MKEYGADRNRKKVKCWLFDKHSENDIIFLRDFVTPYFSDVYNGLVGNEK